MTSCVKLEVLNISQLLQRRTEPWPQATCTKTVKFGHAVFELCEQTDGQMYSLQYFAPLSGAK